MTHGHDSLPQPPAPEPGVLRLRIDPTFGDTGQLKLRVSPELAQHTLEQLRADGAEASIGAEFGLATDLVILAVMMKDNGAWMTLRTVIEAVATRNKDKRIRFELGDSTVEMDGYSANTVERLMDDAHRQFDERAQKWEEMQRRLRPSQPDDDAS
ncbi:hypothetical protein ACPCVO_50325 [Streptomyces umbrinus]|uniref:hypothetical protein n=1 Tax=Streptomyces umbrinus TaxID=67370 RepID=UPI003C30E9D8